VGETFSKTWASRMTVPPLPSSALPQCNIIDVNYRLEVSARGLCKYKGLIYIEKVYWKQPLEVTILSHYK
jgi:hypothetical protein